MTANPNKLNPHFLRILAAQASVHVENCDPENLIALFYELNALYGKSGRRVFEMPVGDWNFTLGFICALLKFDRVPHEAEIHGRPKTSIFA